MPFQPSTIHRAGAPSASISASSVPAIASTTIPQISPRAGLWRYRNDRVGLLTELGDQCVDIVESALGPLRLVIITEAHLARAVLTKNDHAFGKGPAISRHAKPLLGRGLLTSMDDEHRAQRKLLAPRFLPGMIAGFRQTMIDLTLAMLDRWRKQPPSDIDGEFSALTMSIAARTMFGSDIPPADTATLAKGLAVAMRWVIDQSVSVAAMPLWLPTPRNLRMRRALRDMEAMVYRIIAERRADRGRQDVLSTLLAAQDEHGEGMSDREVRDQVMTFFMAGHETVASTMSWCYRLLRNRPEVLDRMAAEANVAFDPASGDLGTSSQAFPYTRAVLNEVMRLRPAAYIIGRQARQNVTIGGYTIRAGSYVAINPLGMHRRPDYFADPLVFRSDRFVGEPTWPRAAFQPFGAGARSCIGNHFALMEATLVLALMARAMRFSGSEDGDIGSDGPVPPLRADALVTLRPIDPVPVSLAWRQS